MRCARLHGWWVHSVLQLLFGFLEFEENVKEADVIARAEGKVRKCKNRAEGTSSVETSEQFPKSKL